MKGENWCKGGIKIMNPKTPFKAFLKWFELLYPKGLTLSSKIKILCYTKQLKGGEITLLCLYPSSIFQKSNLLSKKVIKELYGEVYLDIGTAIYSEKFATTTLGDKIEKELSSIIDFSKLKVKKPRYYTHELEGRESQKYWLDDCYIGAIELNTFDLYEPKELPENQGRTHYPDVCQLFKGELLNLFGDFVMCNL